MVIIGFVIGVLLVAWSGRRLWNGPVGSGWIIPIAVLVVGLWFLYRAIRLARQRGK